MGKKPTETGAQHGLYKDQGFFETRGIEPKLGPYVPPSRPDHFLAHILRSPEKSEHKKLYKYELNVPLTTKLSQLIKLPPNLEDKPLNEVLDIDMDSVVLTAWSEKELNLVEGDISSLTQILNAREPKTLTTLFGSGFLADSQQLDRHNSFVEQLTQSYHTQSQKSDFNSILLGVSCPGFTGTETKHAPNKDSIGVQKYSQLLKAILLTLHPYNEQRYYGKTQLIGHSAGGAAVLNLVHELSIDSKDPYVQAINRHVLNIRALPAALHPAINSSVAKQFILMRDLNQIKYMFGLNNIPQDQLTRIVVRIALGLPPFGPTQKMLQDPAIRDQEDQVTLHCLEFSKNLHAGYAKLDDLRLPQTHGERTGQRTQILTGSKDVITPLVQIMQGFDLVPMGTKKVTEKMIADAQGILDVVPTGHDDFCFNTQTAQYYADYIAQNTTAYLLRG